ncbi:MAG: rhodanese-like domain-containing protein [Flavobacteriaceae bacterium]
MYLTSNKKAMHIMMLIVLMSCVQDIPQVEVIEKEKFLLLMEDHKQLIDVRTPDEFNQGHIGSALNLNVNDPNFEAAVSKLDKNQPVLVYCAVGGRSGYAAKIMKKLGFKKIYDLKGGYRNW